MKHIIFLLCSLFFPVLMLPQELPIDFSNSLHQFVNDPITGTSQFNLITDPTDANNNVAEIINVGGIFKEYDLRLGRLIDVSDPNDNTILLDYYNIIDQPQQVIVVLDNEILGGNTIGVTTTSSGVIGWETLSFDFDNAFNIFADPSEPLVLSQYGMLTLYIYNVPPSTVTTCYIDNISGAQNGAIYREFDGDVTLHSQQEVDNFGTMGYSKVNGSLHIIPQNGTTTTDITDLSPLSSIHTIGISNQSNTFELRGHDNLTSLTGLENLKHLFASFIVKDNPMLQSLSALTNLDDYFASPTSAGELVIDNNDSLMNLNGLNNINMASDVVISNNDNLLIIDNLLINTYDVLIENNSQLSTISNINSDDDISTLTIRNNDNLSLFSNIAIPRIKRDLVIDDNDALTDLSGLDTPVLGIFIALGKIEVLNNNSLQSLNGLNTDISQVSRIRIENNAALTDISFLSNYTQNTLIIKDNDALPSLASLSNYTGGILTIDGNALLTDLTGLSSYTNVPQLNIYNTNLTSLNGLGSITTIGNSLRIENNHSLTDLSALGTVQSIGNNAIVTDFIITNNGMLTSLDGFTSLTNIEADIEFTNNALLDDFCGIETAINNGLVRGYSVSSNLYNPTVQDFNDGMCLPLSVEVFNKNSVNIYPNPTSSTIIIDTEFFIQDVELYNLQGRKISCNYENGKLDMSHLPSGMYILNIIDDRSRVVRYKIIKE